MPRDVRTDSERLAALQAENAWLRERLAQLTRSDAAAALAVTFGLSRQEAATLAVLAGSRGRTLPKAAVYAEVFQHPDGDGPNDKIVDVVLSRLRNRLAGYGWPRDTLPKAFGRRGYSVSPAFRAWFEARFAPQPDLFVAPVGMAA